MTRIRRKRTLFLAIAMAAVMAAGAAAYWTSTGSGSAAASVSNADPITLGPGTAVGYLYPGTDADVAVDVANPNSFPVNLPSLVLDTTEGGGTGFESSESGCDVSALSFTAQDNNGDGWTVPAAATPPELSLELSDAIHMSTAAANECQGASFKVFLKVGM
jgi:hypothetical protein